MEISQEIFIKDFDYELPEERVAFFPLEARDKSKLLVLKNEKISSAIFKSLPDYVGEDSSLVLNNTRVIEARILFQKQSGGVVEIFCLHPSESFSDIERELLRQEKTQWNCFIGGASKWKSGEVLQKKIFLNSKEVLLNANFLNKNVDSFTIEFSWFPKECSFSEVMHAAGAMPLPPYIKRKPVKIDDERYQTIFAQKQGSVAAPTAALHFTQEIFNELEKKNISAHYVTLHVGAGTFKPVKTNTIAEHQMHSERFQVSLKTLENLSGSTEYIAVGTTSLRTLESLYWLGIKIIKNFFRPGEQLNLGQWEAYEIGNENISFTESLQAIICFLKKERKEELFCQTSLLIIPGYKFYSAKALITNFHQPKSTLLLLVAAFIGERWKEVYDYALKNNYRFLSYGDSSLLWRKD